MSATKEQVSAVESFAVVRETGAKNCKPETRVMGSLAVGDAVRQGDVYIKYLGDEISDVLDKITEVEGELQLAPGNTMGSRHTLDSLDGIRTFRLVNANVLQGPVLLADRTFTVAHPEHGDFVLEKGCYGVTYQRKYAEQDLRRVLD